ncbi:MULTISPECIES: type I-B CRISPR-associated protein Cas7/Cst2/DevR [Bacillus cereus group]|uniref:type I-B CRISPR-associated protein Cas7/Cst2/DevR n=1 Tax=Bacillus cereus group TaxID=86661 RepID=UPI00065F8487|nr:MULTISPECIES: type I-B CRISPR-associated protein Cas7/Cst2/DevR [Bacillus cereus group]AWC32687.1 type I-B CRISPR-associated protein Cas7/Cst2/DevR [Bacillus cytotoxicus]AWC36716.1 type I-B CRISPR-associated protein Cas7/Cst2/DevR [Bacillus cytotoxicus]AWC60972.1 type I-B CRISPR-associated protein Cas7/Cst2/DevR [Bacillus cytotoxicus]KMT51154.1 CRISPR-associated protein DevR [Bacillus cytotoxicus]MDH2888350.1 type I-B CRISPR-associated protein Cas7/Cst2/DevR [Bacillus cytotoxicus]
MAGLTLTIVFQGDSLNYGEGIHNISELKKFNRGNGDVHTFASRQAIRYDMVRLGAERYGWNLDTVGRAKGEGEGKNKNVVQYSPSVTIQESEEMDLFGYMRTAKRDMGNKRPASVRLSHAISLEPYRGDLEFLTNLGHASRINEKPNLATFERHTSLYSYTITIDLDRIGVDGEIELPSEEKARRIKEFLEIVFSLNRNIRGRQEDLSPLFAIGGLYAINQPYFLGRTQLLPTKREYRLHSIMLQEILERRSMGRTVQEQTHVGLLSGVFANEEELRNLVSSDSTHTIPSMLDYLLQQVENYYVG